MDSIWDSGPLGKLFTIIFLLIPVTLGLMGIAAYISLVQQQKAYCQSLTDKQRLHAQVCTQDRK
jgi:hypothetical protein